MTAYAIYRQGNGPASQPGKTRRVMGIVYAVNASMAIQVASQAARVSRKKSLSAIPLSRLSIPEREEAFAAEGCRISKKMSR